MLIFLISEIINSRIGRSVKTEKQELHINIFVRMRVN